MCSVKTNEYTNLLIIYKMLAVLQANGLRRASNKNVLGLSLLANTYSLYEEKPSGRIELLLKALRLAHLYHTSWLYLVFLLQQNSLPQ